MVIIPTTEKQPGRNCKTHDGYIQQTDTQQEEFTEPIVR
jgi:hypothetical protein